MNKTINLKDSVYEICTKYPEVKEILADLGFRDITKPGVMSTAGRMMTLPRGASMKGIELSQVISALQENGFEIAETEFSKNIDENEVKEAVKNTPLDKESRTEMLKGYVGRLSSGESLEDVRKDFVTNFKSVDAGEIANAEQELIMSGTPIYDVQRLCDVHSALFHGATREEQIANAEKAVQVSVDNQTEKTSLTEVVGHPVYELTIENEEISKLILAAREAMASDTDKNKISEAVNALRAVTIHYAEKGDLIYPLLKTRYNISGPADVMWGVDDEIRDEYKMLAGAGNSLPDFKERLDKVLTRTEEMVYKENDILLPLCAQNFTEEDWMKIYYELPEYDNPLSGKRQIWQQAEEHREELKKHTAAADTEMIQLGSGHMTPKQIEAVLNTIPLEISFIDDQDINRYFNAGKKLFKRPDEAVDREVYSCHPPRYAVMARQIISELKNGEKDSVDVWMNKQGEPVYVRYMAVRNDAGEYVGTLECVQRMRFAKEHFIR